MPDIAYFINKEQVPNVLRNKDVGSGGHTGRIHKMIKNADAKKVYIVTNFENGEGRVVVAEINIKELYVDNNNKWRFRIKGNENSREIEPPLQYHKMFPDKPFLPPVIMRKV